MTNKSIAISILIIALSTVCLSPAPAQAQVTGATCIVSSALSAEIAGYLGGFLSGEVPVGGKELSKTDAKQFQLDRLASCAAKELLHQMTVSTINWINSGFNGSPAFLTDPGGFLLYTADQFTGEFIAQSGPLAGLCTPWNIDVRLSLGLQQANSGDYGMYSRYRCTLSTIIGSAQNASVEGFVGGDFSQGGWPAFIAMTTEPQNNPYGAYLQSYSDLQAAIGTQESSLSQDLLEGQGFMSWWDCVGVQVTGPVPTKPIKDTRNCVRKTPGSVIANALNVHTNSGVVEAELANDINSVVNALVTQLTSQMLSKGLYSLSGHGSGVSGPGYSSLDSYLSQLQSDSSSGQVTGAYSQAVNLITASRNGYQSASQCFSNKALANPADAAAAQTQITLINNALTTRVTPLFNYLNGKLTTSQDQVAAASMSSSLAASDLANAKSQYQTFSQEAASFQTACSALP